MVMTSVIRYFSRNYVPGVELGPGGKKPTTTCKYNQEGVCLLGLTNLHFLFASLLGFSGFPVHTYNLPFSQGEGGGEIVKGIFTEIFDLRLSKVILLLGYVPLKF